MQIILKNNYFYFEKYYDKRIEQVYNQIKNACWEYEALQIKQNNIQDTSLEEI